jgi:hypothetical protein
MRFALPFFFSFLGLGCLSALDCPEPGPYWPLAKGTYWIYEGDVSYIDRDPVTGQNKAYGQHLTWKSEVVKSFQRGDCTLAQWRGLPEDLAWYKPDTKPSSQILLRIGTDYFLFPDREGTLYAKLLIEVQTEQRYIKELEGRQAWLSAPLVEGKRFGGDPSNFLQKRYCWVVDGYSPFDLKSVRGAPAIPHAEEYSMGYHSNPELLQIRFVPGLGITSYVFHHNGTTMEVAVHLVQFGAPK